MRDSVVQHTLEDRERSSIDVLMQRARKTPEADVEELLREAYWMGAKGLVEALRTPVH